MSKFVNLIRRSILIGRVIKFGNFDAAVANSAILIQRVIKFGGFDAAVVNSSVLVSRL